MTTGHICSGRLAAVAARLVEVIALAGCGSSSSSGGRNAGLTSHAHLATTKVLLRAGLAYGAFHRYMHKPFRNGGCTPVASHKPAIVKAAAAGLFVYHVVKIALVDARSRPTLSRLTSPLTGLQTQLGSLAEPLRGDHLIPAAITGAHSKVSGVSGPGAKSGAIIHDLATPSLGQ